MALTDQELRDEWIKQTGRSGNNSLLDMFSSIPLSTGQSISIGNRGSIPISNSRSLTDYIPSASSIGKYIPSEIPNVFGQQNPMYESLLGAPQSQALSKQSNIAGLLGAAATLAQGMGRQGGRRSAAQNILGALGSGYGAAGQQYQQGLQNYVTQQDIMQKQLAQKQLLQKQDAINQVLNDPAVANDPAMRAFVLNNPDKALEMYVKRRGVADFMARENPQAAPQQQPDQTQYKKDLSAYKDNVNNMLGGGNVGTDGGFYGTPANVIPGTAPVQDTSAPLAAGTVEINPVPEMYTGKFDASMPQKPVAPQQQAPAPQQSALAKQIAQADLLAKYWSTEGDDPVKAKEYQAIAGNLRDQQRQQDIVINPAATLSNVHPSLQTRVATFNERAKGMKPDQVVTEQNDILKDDAKIKEELSQDLFNNKLKLAAAQGGILYETPEKRFERSSSLRKEYTSTPIVKDFEQVKVAYNQINGALKNPSAAGDLAAATKFMKLLDPGSVVRESELGMAMAATGALDRASNYYNLLKTGQKLTPDQRKDFMNVAGTLYKASENVVIPLQSQYRGLAAEAGVNPNSVVVSVPGGPAAQPEAPSVGVPAGVRIRKVR